MKFLFCFLLLGFSLVAVTYGQQTHINRRYPETPGDYYTAGVKTWWQVQTSPGWCLEVKISALDTEESDNCADDFVEVFDGNTTNTPSLGRFCGSLQQRSSPLVVRSTGHIALLYFQSDDDDFTGQGFQSISTPGNCMGRVASPAGPAVSSYKPPTRNGPSSTVNNNNNNNNKLVQLRQTIQYPEASSGQQYYYPGSRQTWSFTTDTTSCLEFKLTGMMMEWSSGCTNDFVAVYDGTSSTNGRRIYLDCGMMQRAPTPVRTRSSSMFVLFSSNQNYDTGMGFRADISDVRNCKKVATKPATSPVRQVIRTTTTTTPEPEVPPSVGEEVCGIPKFEPSESGLLKKRRRRADTAPEDDEELVIGALGRIVGGTVVIPHSWPWQVSIRQKGLHLCGGTLVSRRHIVSAAHCFAQVSTDPEDFEFWVGKHKKDDAEPDTEQKLFAESIILNPLYQRASTWDADLAVIRLREPGAVFTDFVKAACLPTYDMADLSVGSVCYVSGFGETNNTGGEGLLKQAAVPIIDNAKCAELDKAYKKLVTDNMICAGYEKGGHDSCQGDSGGPLVCKLGRHGNWVLSGVVSFGVGCAQQNSPGVYARVSRFLPWLNRKITDINELTT